MNTENPITARELQLRQRYPNHNIEFVYSTTVYLKDLSDNQIAIYGDGRSYYFLLTENSIIPKPKQETIGEVASVHREVADSYQPFFNFFSQEHNLLLTITEMNEIISEVNKHQSEKMLADKDNFAIGFADWINVNAYKYPTKTTTAELLQIYKLQL